jgi:hypothetical protein
LRERFSIADVVAFSPLSFLTLNASIKIFTSHPVQKNVGEPLYTVIQEATERKGDITLPKNLGDVVP